MRIVFNIKATPIELVIIAFLPYSLDTVFSNKK